MQTGVGEFCLNTEPEHRGSYGLLRFVERTDLLILQERLTHAGAEVHLPLQLADLFLPVTRTLGEGQLRGPAHVLLSPGAPVPVLRPLRFLGLSFVMKRCISTAVTRDEYRRVPVAMDKYIGTLSSSSSAAQIWRYSSFLVPPL